jgi:hypothetical protein
MNHLYIIQTKQNGSFKIGRSNDPFFRLKQLQTGNPYALRLLLILENKGYIEKDLHNRLSKYKQKGEWFSEEGLPSLPDWIYEQIDLEQL